MEEQQPDVNTSIVMETENTNEKHVHEKLRQDKQTVLKDHLAKPLIDFTTDQRKICQANRVQASSMYNFAAFCMMTLFSSKAIENRNMNGTSGKGRIPTHCHDTVLFALYTYYGHEFGS